MSVIYNALKKVEDSNQPNLDSNNKKNMKHSKWYYLIHILIVFTGFFVAKIAFDVFIHGKEIKTKSIEPSRTDTAPIPIKPKPPKEVRVISSTLLEKPSELMLPLKERPLPSLTLNGIFFDEKQPCALINNKILKEGDTINGAKVVRILSNKVELEFEGKSIELKTPR